MKTPYTVIVRKSKLQYVAICLELNISACGDTLVEVENNLKDAINLYLKHIEENPDTIVAPIDIEELIEFLKDTMPDWWSLKDEKLILNPFEVHEVPAYA
ncbi:MAG: hypothetical protein HQK76_10020 [Desulfobacterales bacterium]|nr:hypothetical protein [Desulfobacterales bacterium]